MSGRTRDITFFLFNTFFLLFQNLVPTLPTMQLSDVTGDICQITCSLLWSHILYATFITYATLLLKICQHMLMCQIGGVTL